jgi:serine/threonine-protein kinase RsbW
MAADARVFSLTLPSDPRMLSVARTFVEAVGQACSVERNVLHALVMATGEAVTNIIRHAHRNLPAAQLHLQLQLQPDSVVLVFQDQGEPFDIATVPHLNPGEMRIGGRGVYLIRTLMDEVTCEARDAGQRGNVLRMVKRCQPVGPARSCG